jgi:hypothetical protein
MSMALLWIDGFDHYASGQQLRVYEEATGNFNINTSIKRTGSQSAALDVTSSVSKYVNNSPTLIIGAALYVNSGSYNDPSNGYLVKFFDSTTEQCNVKLGQNGRILLYRGSIMIDQTDVLVYPLQQWFYLEVKITFATNGSWTLRINNQVVRSVSGINTIQSSNPYANKVTISGLNQPTLSPVLWDDYYICDTNGTYNNDFLGDTKVVTLYPNAEGSLLQWTPSSGTTHYSLLNENTPNDDTNYVYTSTAGATETANFQDVSLVGSILGIMQNACIRKDDAGARTAALVCKIGSNVYESSEVSIGNSYTFLKQLREVDPSTGLPWSISGFNAAEFGVRMKS